MKAVPVAALALSLMAGCLSAPTSTGPPQCPDCGLHTTVFGFEDVRTPANAPDGFGSEPSLLVAQDGSIYFTSVLGSAPPPDQPTQVANKRGDGLWKSTDNGGNWTYLGKADYPFGGGDSDIDELASGRLLLTGQWRPSAFPPTPVAPPDQVPTYITGGESVSYSDDGGKTWVERPTAGYLPYADRNWLATFGDKIAYLAYNDGASGLMVGKTTDGGVTWLPPVLVQGTTDTGTSGPGPNGISGDIVVDGNGTLYIPYGASIGGGSVERVYRSTDGGQSFKELTARTTPVGETAGGIFSTLAADAFGHLSLVWAETHAGGLRVFLASSADQGDHWTDAMQVSPDRLTAAFPWVAADSAGNLAIGYYATNGSFLPDDAPADASWFPTVTFAGNPFVGPPYRGWETDRVTDIPNHRGAICTQGTGCSSGRALGDFFELAFTPADRVAVIFADDTGDGQANRFALQKPFLAP
jgi:hypothetical protein